MDTELDDGSLVVAYFYKVHFLIDQYFIGFNHTSPEGISTFKMKYFKRKQISFATDSCDVTMGLNKFTGNSTSYHIVLNPLDFDGFGLDFILTPTVDSYRPQDGVITAGSNYFAWLAAVPNGGIKGNITVNGKNKIVSGSGYHDHNWGNTPLQKLFKSWTWFRGKAGPYTVILAELNVVNSRGGFDVPILFVADEDRKLVDKFGSKELFTMKNNLIKNLYSKKNEPQFSNFSIITEDNISVKVSGDEVLENIEIFKRSGLPFPLRWAFKHAGIDPYYTRFSSNFTLKLANGSKFDGTGVMEIMDLQ